MGSATSVSRATVTIVARSKDENACAATRSAGTPPGPRRSSPRATVSIVTPWRSVTSMSAEPVAGADPSCSPRSRFSGVKRHSSSRPPGTSKASTSNEENSSPLFLMIPSAASVRLLVSVTSPVPVALLAPSADGAFHLKLDQPVQLERVLHREFLGDRLHEAAYHH